MDVLTILRVQSSHCATVVKEYPNPCHLGSERALPLMVCLKSARGGKFKVQVMSTSKEACSAPEKGSIPPTSISSFLKVTLRGVSSPKNSDH